MRTRSNRERRANTRYAGEEWVGDVEMFDADVDRLEVDRCGADEMSDPNVAPPVAPPEGHVDKRRRAVRSKKTRPRVAEPAPAAADRSGEHLDAGESVREVAYLFSRPAPATTTSCTALSA